MNPKFEINKSVSVNLLKVGELGFIHKEKKINVQKEHYYPIFIAKNVNELRDRRDT